MITSGSLMPVSRAGAAADVQGAKHRAQPGLPLTSDGRRLLAIINDPEVIMPNSSATNRFIAHDTALEAAAAAITLVKRIPPPLKSIADQVIRSAASVPANLAEGQGRTGRDRVHFWRIAYASAKEVDSHLRLLAGVGAVQRTAAGDILMALDEVRAMIWRLMNPRTG